MIVDVVPQLSDSVVAGLAAAGWPPLRPLLDGTPGKILLIDKHQLDQFMPPRIVFVPVGMSFGPRSMSQGPKPVASNPVGVYDAQSAAAIANPSIGTEFHTFEVSCWGIANPTEQDLFGADYEYTMAMYHQLYTTCQASAAGIFKFGNGVWQTVTHSGRPGREAVFTLTIERPICRQVFAPLQGIAGRPFAPNTVAPSINDSMTTAAGNTKDC